MTSVAATPESSTDAPCTPLTLRIGQLGLGNVGSALARLTAEEAAGLHPHGVAPLTTAALVRSVARPRPAARWVGHLTDDPDVFFAHPLDVVVEAIGGVEPAYSLVRRALERGIPVVTANKSLVAARGEELSDLARRHSTALRYEASCIAGVPFLGTFERRPLVSRVRGLTAILNGTSNTILTAVADGASFDAALGDAQRRGLAEPDPSADITGRDAAEKLTVLIRRFAQLLVGPDRIDTEGIGSLDPADLRAARALGGTLKPIAHACWNSGQLEAFVGPAFLPDSHPLARVSGATNGILLDLARGRQCFIGPGAGPEVTAVTLLDDVCELAGEQTVRTPAPLAARPATPARTAETSWFIRLTNDSPALEAAELLGTYGLWCRQLLPDPTSPNRLYALTFPAAPDRVRAAVDAFHAATSSRPLAIAALPSEEFTC